MSDVFSKAKRSEVMSRIRSRGNKATELEFMRLLRRHHISGWRRHVPLSLESPAPGADKKQKRHLEVKPDFVFRDPRVAVFIDGCFWHGCPLHGIKPAGNAEFWHKKLRYNYERDHFVTRALRSRNWAVLRIWEHELRHQDRVVRRLNRFLDRTCTIDSKDPPSQPKSRSESIRSVAAELL
jgi:DNA mismatch endonuclease, patch repair protein